MIYNEFKDRAKFIAVLSANANARLREEVRYFMDVDERETEPGEAPYDMADAFSDACDFAERGGEKDLLAEARRILILSGDHVVTPMQHKPLSIPASTDRFIYDDGGRAVAGYHGRAGDCVTRAVAIATGMPYANVYTALAKGNAEQRQTRRSGRGGKTARNGICTTRQWFKDYMRSLGFRWVATMSIGSGCKVHLRREELPHGCVIARVSSHYVAVINGIIRDTYDPAREGLRCVYGYWIREAA